MLLSELYLINRYNKTVKHIDKTTIFDLNLIFQTLNMKKSKVHLLSLIIFIYCLITLNINAQEKIISDGDIWKYYDGAIAPPPNWYQSDEITKKWKSGKSSLGYGDKVITTNISFGNDPSNKHTTAYFSKSFDIEDPFKHLFYQINITKDDGIVLYLNGNEIFRNNMPEGEIKHKTRAASLIVNNPMEAYLHTIILPPEDLKVGINTISASVHQGKKTSEDLIFNLELIGNHNPALLPLLLKERSFKDLKLDLRLKEFAHKQELENKELEYRLLQQKASNTKTYLSILVLLLLISIAALSYLATKLVSKQKQENLAKKRLNEKDSEMMNASLNALNSKQFAKGLKKQLEEIVEIKQMPDLKKEIRKTIRHISYQVDSGEDWENLKRHFNVVHSGYLNKLKDQHPSLSDVELRHCIFIKLHMDTKEIASVLNIEPRSVLTSKYRIKKKLNLDENTDLKNYLLSV